MFDFISFARDTGTTVNIIPGRNGTLVSLEIVDPDGYVESCEITDSDVRSAANVDIYTGQMLSAMIAKIGSRKAEDYARLHHGNQRRALEDFWRNR